jgi:hypothetical protein
VTNIKASHGRRIVGSDVRLTDRTRAVLRNPVPRGSS